MPTETWGRWRVRVKIERTSCNTEPLGFELELDVPGTTAVQAIDELMSRAHAIAVALDEAEATKDG